VSATPTWSLEVEELRAALTDANLPTLLTALAQITGDPKWMEAPYRPTRLMGPGDNDSGGFDEPLQQSIRDDALAILAELDAGRRSLAPPPPSERIAEWLSISLGGLRLPDGFGPLLAEELGVSDRRVELAPPPAAAEFRVLVIGSGFSGLNAAIRLGEAGIAYEVLEKNDHVGGTWWENTYPGCGVDTPSHLYSLSFAQRSDWPRYFARRDDLHTYLEALADEHGVRANIRFGTEATRATWDGVAQLWRVEARDARGETVGLSANAVITGVGFLNRPAFPRIDGLGDFAGPVVHTAQWPRDLDVAGRRVAVIGTGASAMQLVPTIAESTERVLVFQRSPQWAVPHPNYHRAVTASTRLLMERVPHYLGWYRLRQVWLFGDRLHQRLRLDRGWRDSEHSINAWNDGLRDFLIDYIRSQLGDRADELIDKCLPQYPPYGKRPLIDNGWWRTMARDDVDLITDDVTRVTADAVHTASGEAHPVDVIVLATGFQAARVLHPMEVRGRSGASLRELWGEDDARAYLGITVPDLPNFFLLLGPNTFPGHGGSGVLTSELAMRYVMETLATMVRDGVRTVECRREVHDAYNDRLDEALAGTIWAHPGMTTYYRNSRGRIVVPMPWSNVEYWHMIRRPDLADYHLTFS
jgi:4-hydroxyacetophenone monooxygenase